MLAFIVSAVVMAIVYLAVRDIGWQLENDEIVGAAPVPAGIVGGIAMGVNTLIPAYAARDGSGIPAQASVELAVSGLLFQIITGAVGFCAGAIISLVMLEVFVDEELDTDRFQPRLVPALRKRGSE